MFVIILFIIGIYTSYNTAKVVHFFYIKIDTGIKSCPVQNIMYMSDTYKHHYFVRILLSMIDQFSHYLLFYIIINLVRFIVISVILM